MCKKDHDSVRDDAEVGNVRPEKIKKVARELIQRYPDKFTLNFEENKKIIESLARIPSRRLRNRIAGYITRLVLLKSGKSTETQ